MRDAKCCDRSKILSSSEGGRFTNEFRPVRLHSFTHCVAEQRPDRAGCELVCHPNHVQSCTHINGPR
ncbi:hypothetical protein FRIGORI9N_280012 [Frigoribacterium sp. 9N]|nr:hypothetical protein FRIGORI9N_280012 [Frigoribacterium sp. 9N]